MRYNILDDASGETLASTGSWESAVRICHLARTDDGSLYTVEDTLYGRLYPVGETGQPDMVW